MDRNDMRRFYETLYGMSSKTAPYCAMAGRKTCWLKKLSYGIFPNGEEMIGERMFLNKQSCFLFDFT